MRTDTTAAATLVLILAAAPAAAQRPVGVPADSVFLYKLEGISVTVSRSALEVERLPYAVGVLGAEDVQGLEATISLDESLAQIPGVFVDNRYNFALGARISIRGFGARTQFGVRGVRIIQDGIPLTLPDGQAQTGNLDLGAAGRIEVIRGPASALYGNASGGVISVQTESAPAAALRPEFRALAGGYGNGRSYQKYDLKLGGQQGRFDYLGHLAYFDSDGFRTHSEATYTLLNARLRYELDRNADLTLVVNYADAPQAENPSTLTDSVARVKPDTVRDIVLPPEECPPDPGFGGCQNLGEEFRQGQAGVTYRRRFGGTHEISLMGYGLFRELENRIPFRLIELDRLGGGARAEYRLTPAEGRLARLTAGLDLDSQWDDRVELVRDDETVGPAALDQDERVTALGLFAHGGLVLASGLELTLSLRYDRVRFQVDDRLVTGDDPDDSGTRNMDQWSPMVGLSYSYATWLNLYGNVGRSFQTPTTTELTDTLGGFNAELQPERATNYEIGVKGTAGGRASYSLALFHTDVEDQLIGSAAAGTERVLFENAGSSVHEGIEVGISALVAPSLTATAAYTYSDFKFEEFVTEAGDFSRNRVPGVPPHRLHARLGYAGGRGLSGSLQLTAADDHFVDNASESRNDGYTVVDLRLGFTAHTPGFEIAPFLGLNNLFDERYNSSVVVNAIAGRYYEPAPGRNLYVGVRLSTR
ncbi:MAG: TonB-dependent receptor [Gemmatimonadota bacterium]|nr:MAG: TonB-dependent receptor [Gemmatimonadota bacterium]